MPSKKQPEPVSGTELQILDLLWVRTPRSIRDICMDLYGDTAPSYYGTVQSLLLRLEAKGWVRRDRSTRQHLFRPMRTRSDFIGQQIQGMADAVCGGSVAALLGQLAGSGAIRAKEREELRKLVDGEES